MSSGKVRVFREELIRMMSILGEIEGRRLDPFSVDVSSLLQRLREIIERERDSEIVVLDAETLYRVTVVLGLQQRWIRDRASSLFIDANLVYSKILSADPRDLVSAFLQAWRPIARIEQISVELLMRGYEHFLSKPARGLTEFWGEAAGSAQQPSYEAIEKQISADLEELLAELSSRRGWTNYWEFIGAKGVGERARRAYLLSYLISRGEVEVRVDTLRREIWIRAAGVVSDEPRTTSLVVSLGRGGEAA